MIRFLAVHEVEILHRRLVETSGGSHGLRDRAALDSAVHQPLGSFGGEDLYPTLVEKAAALAFSLVMNHPFVDGNKRIGHAAMEVFLLLNGFAIDSTVDDQERLFLGLAAGLVSRDELVAWVLEHVKPVSM